MEDASKGPPEFAADARANISEVRLEPSAAATGGVLSEPCPCCGNRERCLLRPTRGFSSSSPPPLPPTPQLVPSPSTRRAPPSRALSIRPLPPPPSPSPRSISPSFRARLELPSAEAFRSPPPAVDPPIGHLCSDLDPPLSLPSLSLPPQQERRLERSNSRETTPATQETAITCLANDDDTRGEDGDGRPGEETPRKRKKAQRASPAFECHPQ